MQSIYAPCIPTAGRTVPSQQEWLHEIKYDGYRPIVIRDDKRVGLLTRNGHDWSDRFQGLSGGQHRKSKQTN